ncbi:MAG: ATP-dependent Clp protease ATP-binding subunit [Lentisphaeraceae bacterium]|nr:ATP-dependent Clp protease ATP-binding subunit [Lentisphaeraceae bacterium]
MNIDLLNNLIPILKKRVIGQDLAIEELVEATQRGELGLTRSTRPKANFLFVGPTGVGKTELCLALAEALYGSTDKMLRFDMSEYMDKRYIAQLIGDEDKQEPGRLGRGLAKLGPSGGILLFDEMEKAHKDIMDVFLQILDAARITTGDGVCHDLSNYYVILTSNIGAQKIADGRFNTLESMKRSIMTEFFRLQYRPEFIGRFDNIVCFAKLDYQTQRVLAELMVKKEIKRFAQEKNIILEYENDFIEFAIENGINEKLGARPLRNFTEKCIQNAVAEKMLQKKETHGKIKVDFIKGKVWIEPLETVAKIEDKALAGSGV